MPPRPSKRAELVARATKLEQRLRALEAPTFLEVALGFDPTPLPVGEGYARSGGLPVESPAEPLPGDPAVEKRVGANGQPVWVLKVAIV